MDVVLIGADFEENLGVGAIAAVARQAGHAVGVVPFNVPAQAQGIAERLEDAELLSRIARRRGAASRS